MNLLKRKPRIAISGMAYYGLDEEILNGFLNYRIRHPEWLITYEGHSHENLAQVLQGTVDGVIARIQSEETAKLLQRQTCPVIDLSGWFPKGSDYRVCVDSLSVGAYAADYFANKGYKHFVYYSDSGHAHPTTPWAGFKHRLSERGFDCFWYTLDPYRWHPDSTADVNEFAHCIDSFEWMKEFPKPFAVFAPSDRMAFTLCEVARYHQVSVPEEMAVLGTGNHDIFTLCSSPHLSSIQLPGEAMGEQVGKVLEGLLAGTPPPQKVYMHEAIRIQERKSTELYAIEHPLLAKVLAWIGKHAASGIHVQDVAQAFHIDRRSLNRIFYEHLNRSTLEEIHRVRLAHINELLQHSDQSLLSIAISTGFSDDKALIRFFKGQTGETPGTFRKNLP